MPENLTFNIAGTGSINFVRDWALAIGYSPQVVETGTGELIDNPLSNSEYIINNMFEHAKNLVSDYRMKQELPIATATIADTIATDLSDISVEIG